MMRLNSKRIQYDLKLRSFKEVQDNSQANIFTLQSMMIKKQKRKGQKEKIEHLEEVIKKIRIDKLVGKFIDKASRNIPRKSYTHYQTIQDKIAQKKEEQQYLQSYNLDQNIKAFIVILDIICVLVIQTLSTFHGFYEDYIRSDSKTTTIIFVQVFCIFIFFLKLLMGLTTPRIASGAQSKYMRYVAKQYIFSIVFIFNSLNVGMTILKVVIPDSKQVGIVSFVVSVLSMPVLTEDLEIVETTYINNFKKKHYYAMLKLLLFNIFFAQFISTLFVAIAYFDLQHNWIVKAQLAGHMRPDLNWWQQYFYALYWAIVTIATIGFGDITPANYFETGMLCILMLVGTSVLSYNVTSIGNIVENLRSVDEQRKSETIVFKRICADEKISPELQNKIIDFIYKSAQIREGFEYEDRKNFLEKLPTQLRNDLQSEYADHIFSKMPFFKLLTQQTLVNISISLKSQIYYPGQDLILVGGRLSKILLLKQGQIGLTYDKAGSTLNGLILQTRKIQKQKNQPYLLNKYLLDPYEKINYRIVAGDYSVMLVLQHQEFYEILRESDKDHQLYFHMRHQETLIGEQWDMFECKECAPKKHSIFQCPKLHYMPFKSTVVDRYLYGPAKPQISRPHFKRNQNRLKKKKALRLWKRYFQEYEQRWQINYYKHLTEHNLSPTLDIDFDLDQDNYVKPKNTNIHRKKTISSQHIIQADGSIEQSNYDFIAELGQRILSMHCCEANKKLGPGDELRMDVMHNFVNYFPNLNPNHFIMKPLKSQNKKLPAKYRYFKTNQTYIDDNEIRLRLK